MGDTKRNVFPTLSKLRVPPKMETLVSVSMSTHFLSNLTSNQGFTWNTHGKITLHPLVALVNQGQDPLDSHHNIHGIPMKPGWAVPNGCQRDHAQPLLWGLLCGVGGWVGGNAPKTSKGNRSAKLDGKWMGSWFISRCWLSASKIRADANQVKMWDFLGSALFFVQIDVPYCSMDFCES